MGERRQGATRSRSDVDAVHERAVPSSGTGERPMMEADR